jgi:amidase
MSMRDVADPLEGQEAVRSTPGPMAHSPDDIDLVMKTYMLSEPWRSDPAVLRLPWMQILDAGQKFCFAIAYGDEHVSL